MTDTEISFKVSAHDDFIVYHAVVVFFVLIVNKQPMFLLISLTPKTKLCRTLVLNDPIDVLIHA